jgi:thioesterase domain-containing protein/NAD(P)-dependent dehydrogenase (short-subunit alcohol dehydrogenase family)/acyl carrier protein
VYLITGGLGGIGLVVAEHLARNWKARLVLIGRSELPSPSEWANIASGRSSHAHAAAVRKLIEIQSAGAEILTLAADVTSTESLKSVVQEAERKFGRIDGVIHAAGVIEDSPLQLKTRESAARVLAPKVRGTLVLDEVLNGKQLDFLVLFSSISAVLPPAGQVDYAAANAFLDAFAASRQNTTSINWGRWNVGMGGEAQPTHPLLDRTVINSPDETVYSGQFNCERFWLLSEHRLKNGKALVPGTGYLELATAALMRGSFAGGVVLEDIFFLSPMMFAADENKEVRVQLRRDRAGFRFSILANDGGWSEYASGHITRNTEKSPAPVKPDEIAGRCRFRTIEFDDSHRTRQENYFDFGPRWRNLNQIHIGEGEGLSELELRSEFRADLPGYQIHPALLDLATGSALYLIEGYEHSQSLYLPFSYKRIRVFKPLPAKMWSHIRSHQENTAQRDIASFDFTLFDDRGEVLAEIEEFSVRRMSEVAATGEIARPRATKMAEVTAASSASAGWIDPAIGAEALARVLSGEFRSTIVVAPGDIAPVKTTAAPATAAPSPQPGNEVETVLSTWWEELLGVERVGLDDDFFDLGGQSLVAVRLFSKIRKTYNLDLGLSVLFEHRTIRELAKRIRPAEIPVSRPAAIDSSAIVAIRSTGKRLPLFLISGLGGNVLNFQKLAKHLGEEQPVYALQPQGLDGKKPFLTRVEDMAAYYIAEIKHLQPEGPYCLAGYSFGGFVAYEMAQQISAAGGRVGLLGLLDTIEWHYLERIKDTLRLQDRFTLYKSRIDHVLFGEDRLDYLKERLNAQALKYLYFFYKTIGRPVPQTVGNITDINTFAAANYKPRPYAGTLTIFRSVKREALDGDDELLGWGGLAAGGFEVHDVPGTHHDMTQEPNVRILADEVGQCLARVVQEPSVVLRKTLDAPRGTEPASALTARS